MTHQFCLPHNLYATCNLIATVINVLECCSNHVHVVVGIYTACDAETEKVETSEAVLACHRIAVGKDVVIIMIVLFLLEEIQKLLLQ